MQVVAEASNWEGPPPGIESATTAGSDNGLEPGNVLAGRYRLDEVIGRGGMATVWRSHDERLGRDVAIKICPPATTDYPRTIREERLSSALLHPNIVSIFDAGDLPASPGQACASFIVMEYVDGTTAHDVAPVSWQVAISIVRQAAEGLAAAHERGIVHCDVKPGNLLIDRRNRVLVADFGIALPAESDVGDFVHGSPAYIAPERLTGAPADPRVDVYGLGGVLSYLITGKRPTDDAGSLSTDCPQAIAEVIAKARAREPQNRYANARAFRIALDNAAGGTRAVRASDTMSTSRIVPNAPRGGSPQQSTGVESSRRVISHPMRVRAAQPPQLAQQTAAMSSSPVRVARLAPSIPPRRAAYRPMQRHRPATLVVAGILALLVMLAAGITLREIVSIDGVSSDAPSASAAVEMPDVQGQTFATAIEMLSRSGIVVERVEIVYGPGPTNQVVAQQPQPGASIGADDSVILIVGTDT